MAGKPLSIDMALRKAETLAKRGETEAARQYCGAVLAKFPTNRRALAIMQALQATRPAQGSGPAGAGNAALSGELNALIALHRQGRPPEVRDRAMALARRFPGSPVIPNILGAACIAMNRPAEAIASFRRALEIDPRFVPAYNNLGAALSGQGREEEAVEVYRAALRIDPDYAEAHGNLGNALRKLGRLDEAAESYARAVMLRPNHADARRNLAATLHRSGRDAEAAEHYARALELAPEDAEMHNDLGVSLNALGRHDEAIASYRAALALKPDLRQAYNNLCELYEKTNRIDDLRAAVAPGEAAGSEITPDRHYWLAEVARRDGRHADALDHLEAIDPGQLPLHMQLKRSDLLGKTYDRLDRLDRAFPQFAETNRLAAAWQSSVDYDAERYVNDLAELKRSWSVAPRTGWEPPVERTGPSLAFLVGFPRSGTTLLDTVLRSHPGVAVVEEQPTVERIRTDLGAPATYEVLEALDADAVGGLRAAYLEELGRHIADPAEGRLVIDKLPLNLVNAGLIHRVFPEAKFILALRHPCDSVLSCFMQNFRLNDAMANFLDLGRTAALYDLAMGLWCDYEAKLGLEVAVLKYEDLVTDLQSAIEPVLGFLGLDWDERVLGYRETALARGRINTPSYNQVTRALYHQAIGRWENYRAQLAPVLQVLEPWAARWGYVL